MSKVQPVCSQAFVSAYQKVTDSSPCPSGIGVSDCGERGGKTLFVALPLQQNRMPRRAIGESGSAKSFDACPKYSANSPIVVGECNIGFGKLVVLSQFAVWSESDLHQAFPHVC